MDFPYTNQNQSKCSQMIPPPAPAMDCSCGRPPATIPNPSIPQIQPPRMEQIRMGQNMPMGHAKMGQHMPMEHARMGQHMPMEHARMGQHMPMEHARMGQHMPMEHARMGQTMPMNQRYYCPDTSVGGMEQYPVAMGYVPWQQWQQTYPLERGFQRGTIFPDLDLPFDMGRCR